MSQSSPETLQRIEELVKSERVVLFMKGTPTFPQCGFSATVVQILNGLLPTFQSVNVLDDPAIRQGIKDYSNWPTIPQLYVEGELVGGCDIVREMYSSGELQEKLGVTPASVEPPEIELSDPAAAALKAALEEAEEGDVIHLAIDPRFEHSLGLAPPQPRSVVVKAAGIELHLDVPSAQRASGLKIDFVESAGEAGFKIENPNAPPRVLQLTPKELKEKLDAGEIAELLDVRTAEERATAKIEGSRPLDDDTVRYLGDLDRSRPLAFYCHRGGRSYAAAEHFVKQGFRVVYNLAGGIDAWSQEVDPDVPRY